MTILIVEDEAPIRSMLSFALKRAGYETKGVSSVEEAWNVLGDRLPKLILLDWMLPDQTGVTFLSKLRQLEAYKNIPVIMLTARADESSKLRGFEAGADDYVTKPFSPKELLARMNALLKRSQQVDKAEAILTVGSITLNLENHELCCDGKIIKIGGLEFKLLTYLMKHPNKALSRSVLLSKVWKAEKEVSERTVDVHIRRVRSVLEPLGYGNLILSIRGIGYKLVKEMNA